MTLIGLIGVTIAGCAGPSGANLLKAQAGPKAVAATQSMASRTIAEIVISRAMGKSAPLFDY